MIEVDLHLHTTFSDGTLTPTEVVKLGAERGLKVICISDHDTTNGLPETMEAAKAYPFTRASEEGVINDLIGPFPVVVLADKRTKSVYSYVRKGGDQVLEFILQDGILIDVQTGSSWDVARGIAIDGPLRGEVLQRVPYSSAYDWAWKDFYPHSDFYTGA